MSDGKTSTTVFLPLGTVNEFILINLKRTFLRLTLARRKKVLCAFSLYPEGHELPGHGAAQWMAWIQPVRDDLETLKQFQGLVDREAQEMSGKPDADLTCKTCDSPLAARRLFIDQCDACLDDTVASDNNLTQPTLEEIALGTIDSIVGDLRRCVDRVDRISARLTTLEQAYAQTQAEQLMIAERSTRSREARLRGKCLEMALDFQTTRFFTKYTPADVVSTAEMYAAFVEGAGVVTQQVKPFDNEDAIALRDMIADVKTLMDFANKEAL